MSRQSCLIVTLAIAVVGGSHAAAQTAQTSETKPVQFVRTPESGQSAGEVRARMRHLESRLQPAVAEPATDLVLDQARVAIDESGAALFTMKGTVKQDVGGWFVWIVDAQKKSYRLIRMDGTSDDAVRIAQHLNALGVSADLNSIQDRINRARANRAKQRREAVSHQHVHEWARDAAPAREARKAAPDLGARAAGEFGPSSWGTCSGSLEGHVETWELASLIAGPFPLTRSYAYNQWIGWWDELGWGGWTTYRGGSCWAEPLSFAYTTWYWDTCNFYFPGTWPGFSDVAVEGNYHNFDFGVDELPTFVFSGIGLTGSNGTISYSTFHYADGEGVFYEEWGLALIWGEVWINPFSYNDCPWM